MCYQLLDFLQLTKAIMLLVLIHIFLSGWNKGNDMLIHCCFKLCVFLSLCDILSAFHHQFHFASDVENKVTSVLMWQGAGTYCGFFSNLSIVEMILNIALS